MNTAELSKTVSGLQCLYLLTLAACLLHRVASAWPLGSAGRHMPACAVYLNQEMHALA